MPLGKGLNSLLPGARRSLRKETGTSASKDQLWQIPLSEIVPNSEQPRKHFSHAELEDLVESIKIHGILQPLIVIEREDGGYELIAGERRFRAATIVGLATVPCIVRMATRQEKLELALIENIQRQDLNVIEEAFAFQRLADEFGLSHDDIAHRVGKSRPSISNAIRLLGLPAIIQQALIEGKIHMAKARAILSLRDEADQLEMFHRVMTEHGTVEDVERAISSKGPISRKGSIRMDPNLRAQEKLLEERLGAKVMITKKGERGTIVIHYHSTEEFRHVMQVLT